LISFNSTVLDGLSPLSPHTPHAGYAPFGVGACPQKTGKNAPVEPSHKPLTPCRPELIAIEESANECPVDCAQAVTLSPHLSRSATLRMNLKTDAMTLREVVASAYTAVAGINSRWPLIIYRSINLKIIN
jgi:hypothetical protein